MRGCLHLNDLFKVNWAKSPKFDYNAANFVGPKCNTVAIKQKRQGNHTLLATDNYFDRVELSWFDPAWWQQQHAITGTSVGRGTTYFVRWDQQDWVLRHYRRGGLIGKWVKQTYTYPGIKRTRAYRELELLNTLYHGYKLPCPRPVAGHVQHMGSFYRCDLLIERISDATDVHHLLCRGPVENNLWRHIGETIRRFHDKQVYHHDLNIHNLLLDNQQQAWLIDFDKCELRIGDKWKADNLARLQRSLLKESSRQSQYHFQQENWQSLLDGYGK